MPKGSKKAKKSIDMVIMKRIYELGEDITVVDYHINHSRTAARRLALMRFRGLLVQTISKLEER